ncbi:3D domain-containing protein [Methylobacterium sp. 17Sr1-1]|uniref:3D domain-containing protein n=1 Tax=Methylobacterium sp. 17Sr1-1 TaxID=2202826 RepID=UPI001FDF8FFE|nr:3D domain-containing protein [Methylobacterium sp. 17Sr1-1]
MALRPAVLAGRIAARSGGGSVPLRRLVVAQDTGSAILGPARGDLYLGTGARAGAVAGLLRDPARFVVLLPKQGDAGAAP